MSVIVLQTKNVFSHAAVFLDTVIKIYKILHYIVNIKSKAIFKRGSTFKVKGSLY